MRGCPLRIPDKVSHPYVCVSRYTRYCVCVCGRLGVLLMVRRRCRREESKVVASMVPRGRCLSTSSS